MKVRLDNTVENQPVTGSVAVTAVSGTVNVRALDGTMAVYFSPANPSVNATIDTSNTFKIAASDGTIAVYFSPASPSLGTINRVDRVMNVVDGTIGVENVTRVRNLVDGTLSLLTTVTGVDRVRNVVDGTLTTVTGLDRVRNVVDGTLSLVSMTQRVNNVVDGTLSLVTMTQRVNNVVDGTIGIARFGSNAVVTPNAGIPVVNTSNTMSIFTASGSYNGVSTLGTTLAAPSAFYNYKVFAYSITTTGIVGKTVRFTNGAGVSPTEFWRLGLQAPTTSSTGANFGVQPPGFLFATGVNTTLALLLDTASLVHYSVSYIKESA